MATSSQDEPEAVSAAWLRGVVVMQSLAILLVLLGAVPTARADSGFKTEFAKHRQVAKEFILARGALGTDRMCLRCNAESMIVSVTEGRR